MAVLIPYIFASMSGPNVPVSDIDANFANLAAAVQGTPGLGFAGGGSPWGLGTGVNTITVNTSPSFSALSDGSLIRVRAAQANTGASVNVNANSNGNIPVTEFGGVALVAGAIW